MGVTVADAIRSELQTCRELPPPTERRRLRINAGLSQQKLADIVGATRQAVCQWESGYRAKPRNPIVLQRYAEALQALREVA